MIAMHYRHAGINIEMCGLCSRDRHTSSDTRQADDICSSTPHYSLCNIYFKSEYKLM